MLLVSHLVHGGVGDYGCGVNPRDYSIPFGGIAVDVMHGHNQWGGGGS